MFDSSTGLVEPSYLKVASKVLFVVVYLANAPEVVKEYVFGSGVLPCFFPYCSSFSYCFVFGGTNGTFIFDMVSGKPFLYSDFNRYTEYGKNQIYLINSLIEHFFKLLVVKGRMIKGENMISALRGLKPPIFFKFEKQFISQVSKWGISDIRETIKKLQK